MSEDNDIIPKLIATFISTATSLYILWRMPDWLDPQAGV